MKFTKKVTIDKFDLGAFNIGDLYYISMRGEGTYFKGLFLCYDKDNETEEVEFATVATMDGLSHFRSLMIGQKDLPYIEEIRRADVESEHDLEDNLFPDWWNVYIYVDLDGKDDE